MDVLNSILEKSKVTGKGVQINFSSIEPKEKYFIQDLEEFWSVYDKLYEKGNINKTQPKVCL